MRLFGWLVAACSLLITASVTQGAQPLNLRLKLRNESMQAWTQKPITSGVMLPRGAVATTNSLVLGTAAGGAVPAQFLATAWWPNHTLKWVLVDFQASLAAGASQIYTLKTGAPSAVTPGVTVQLLPASIQVTVNGQTTTFSRNEFKVLGREFQIVRSGVTYRATPFAALEPDAFPAPAQPWMVEEAGPLKLVLKSEGSFRNVTNAAQEPAPYIRYRARIYFYAGQPAMTVYLTLMNNQSYDWPDESPSLPLPDQNFSAIRFGGLSLAPGATNLFGAGIEKTWQVQVTLGGGAAQPVVVQVDPARSANTRRAEPLLAQDAADVEQIGGFGLIEPVLASTDASLNAVLARFEKTQRAKVIPEETERLANGTMPGTVFDHMAPQLGNYKDYGCLEWADGWSRNHYDWIYSMDLHWLRTGESRFVDAATIFARHGADLDIYHTWHDNPFFNFMTNWEGAGGGGGTHNNPWSVQGNGRPSHTWPQGLMLHWLLTGDRRCRDAAYELLEGARQFLYLAQGGRVPDREVRIEGWLAESFLTGWLVDPFATLDTGGVGSGSATYKEAALAALQPILDLEQADGSHGYIRPDETATEYYPLQMHYILEPLIKAYDWLLKGTPDRRAGQYLGLIYRIVDNNRAHYYFGDTTSAGYRPLQTGFMEPLTPHATPPADGNELPWLLMAANGAAYVYSQRHDAATLAFARKAFRDFIYYREAGSGTRIDPATRTPTGYISLFYDGTSSKIHGWSGRFGQYYLKMERELGATLQAGERTEADRRAWGLYP